MKAVQAFSGKGLTQFALHNSDLYRVEGAQIFKGIKELYICS